MVNIEKNPYQGHPHEYIERGGGELDFDLFRRELKELIRAGDPYVADVDLGQFDGWDVRTWMFFRAGRLTREEFKRRFETALKAHPVKREDMETDSRLKLYGFIEAHLKEPAR